MKVKLLKDHVLGNKGDIIDCDYERAQYLVRCGVADVETKDITVVYDTVDEKPKTVKRKPRKKK